jgi:hypothetical protein
MIVLWRLKSISALRIHPISLFSNFRFNLVTYTLKNAEIGMQNDHTVKYGQFKAGVVYGFDGGVRRRIRFQPVDHPPNVITFVLDTCEGMMAAGRATRAHRNIMRPCLESDSHSIAVCVPLPSS